MWLNKSPHSACDIRSSLVKDAIERIKRDIWACAPCDVVEQRRRKIVPKHREAVKRIEAQSPYAPPPHHRCANRCASATMTADHNCFFNRYLHSRALWVGQRFPHPQPRLARRTCPHSTVPTLGEWTQKPRTRDLLGIPCGNLLRRRGGREAAEGSILLRVLVRKGAHLNR